MRRASLLGAAACFALALGLPFGRPTAWNAPAPALLVRPYLVESVGTLLYRHDGSTVAVPGTPRVVYLPFFFPTGPSGVLEAPPGRTTPARVVLVGLLAAAFVASRRGAPTFERRAALGGAVVLVAQGLLSALPSSGAVVAVLGLALLAWGGGGGSPAAAPVAPPRE